MIRKASWLLLLLLVGCAQSCQDRTGDEQPQFASYDPRFPPSDQNTKLFELSQDYPTKYAIDNPWLSIDFRKNPDTYIRSVLEYALEGNIEVQFQGQQNRVRKWYHAPWLHDDGEDCGNGREHLHGLTRERSSPPREGAFRFTD